jgi:hypothetical protein
MSLKEKNEKNLRKTEIAKGCYMRYFWVGKMRYLKKIGKKRYCKEKYSK